MREIKFRAKTISTGNWVESMTIAKGTIKRKRDDYFFELDENRWVGVDAKTVGQFTGLNDKNGKAIYEGDIVEIIHPCWSATCETKFIDGAFWFIEKDNPVNNSQIRADKFLKQGWKIKVLGNVFENSELLNF